MAFATVPRDGKIFDVNTADCLNAQISVLDNKIDDYYVNNLSFVKNVKRAPTDHIKEVSDSSFYVEKIYCLRLSVPVSKSLNYKDKWKYLATIPVDIPYEINSMVYSDEGYNWFFKIDNDNKCYITGSSDVAKDNLHICLDLIILQNPLIV